MLASSRALANMKSDQKNTPGQPREAVKSTWKSRLTHWLEIARNALVRAEKKIIDNFRVPPGGG